MAFDLALVQIFTRIWCVRWLQLLLSFWIISILSQNSKCKWAEGRRQVNNKTEHERILLRALWIWSKHVCWWIFRMLYRNVPSDALFTILFSLRYSRTVSLPDRVKMLMCRIYGCPAEKLEPAALMGRLGDADWHIRWVLSVVFCVSSPAPAFC